MTQSRLEAASRYEPYQFSTLAGDGTSGTADGLGASARFNTPQGLAMDRAGNLYVADSWNHTIRKITSGGLVTTLAGSAGQEGKTDGPAPTARFSSPWGVAVDGSGNVYVADGGNNAVRKISSEGVVTTLPGLTGIWPGRATGLLPNLGANIQGEAGFNGPWGIATDAGGVIYLADVTAIRKYSGGSVTVLAGLATSFGSTDGSSSIARFFGINSLIVDDVGTIYAADSNNHTIRRITIAGEVTTLAGEAGTAGSEDGAGTEARFNSPFGVAVSGGGTLYVADSWNYTIRKITAAGEVTTLAGVPGTSGNEDGIGEQARFKLPRGIAVESSGIVYVVDSWNHTIRKGVPAGGLSIAAVGGQVKLSWVDASSIFWLESTADLRTSVWSPVTGNVQVESGTNSLTLPTDAPTKFFRLAKP